MALAKARDRAASGQGGRLRQKGGSYIIRRPQGINGDRDPLTLDVPLRTPAVATSNGGDDRADRGDQKSTTAAAAGGAGQAANVPEALRSLLQDLMEEVQEVQVATQELNDALVDGEDEFVVNDMMLDLERLWEGVRDNQLNQLKFGLRLHKVAKSMKYTRRRRPSRAVVQRRTAVTSMVSDIIVVPHDVSELGLGGRAATEIDIVADIRRRLKAGHVVLFGFALEPKEHYFYESEDTTALMQQGACGGGGGGGDARPNGETLLQDYEQFRGQYNIRQPEELFREGVVEFMRTRHERYLTQMAILQAKYNRCARIVLLRLQDKPDQVLEPPRFGDLVVSWSPNRDDGTSTLEDKMLLTPLVVQKLKRWLGESGILESYTRMRDSASTAQGQDCPLDYDTNQRRLFNIAIVR